MSEYFPPALFHGENAITYRIFRFDLNNIAFFDFTNKRAEPKPLLPAFHKSIHV